MKNTKQAQENLEKINLKLEQQEDKPFEIAINLLNNIDGKNRNLTLKEKLEQMIESMEYIKPYMKKKYKKDQSLQIIWIRFINRLKKNKQLYRREVKRIAKENGLEKYLKN